MGGLTWPERMGHNCPPARALPEPRSNLDRSSEEDFLEIREPS
jgi:hypothetical protein